MTAVWIMLFVCMSSSSSCSQGDVSVANTSYASSEECYADGMKRARGARRRLHRREARTMKPWRAPCGLGPLCTRINPETAIHSNTGNSPCSLSVVNLLLRRKPARAAVAPAQRPRGSAFEPDTETRLPPRFRPGIAPPVGARIADGASVAQGILEFPFGPFRERSSRMD